MFSGALVTATVICAWQARNHAKHRDELARASLTDPLTGCLNRRGFEERLLDDLETRDEVTLLVFDLDGFKRVNDQHGHGAGDELLRWVAGVLRATLRAEDVVGRLGGDEFAAIVPGGDPYFVMRRVVAALAERVSVSAGLAIFPHDGETPDAPARVRRREHVPGQAPPPRRRLAATATGYAPTMTRVGWIGLGAMGGPMAACAARAGHELRAYDVDPDRVPEGVEARPTRPTRPAAPTCWR